MSKILYADHISWVYSQQQHINPALFLHPSEEIDLLLHYADDDGHDIISSGSDYEGEEEEGEELYIDADFDAAFDWHWRNHDVLHANGGPPHAAVALNHNYNHPHHHLPRHRQHPDQHRHPHHYSSSSSSSSSWPNVPLFYGDLLKSSHFRRGRAVRDYLRATTRQRPQPRQQPRQQHRQQQHYHQLAALGGGGHNSSPILFIAVRE